MKFFIPRTAKGFRLWLAIGAIASFSHLNAHADSLSFNKIFSDKGESKRLHYQAVFTAKGEEHQLEVWRDGQQRLKRRTDDTIEIYANRKPGDVEYSLSILDLKKHIHTRIDRTNLYRIGNFTDWFDLAHGLKHPKGEYRLEKASAPAKAPETLSPCQWYDLIQSDRATHICWSTRYRLPLLIVTSEGQVAWRVSAVDEKLIAPGTFTIHDEGYIRNDANQDIEKD
ncbi:hypothetical protein ACO0KY_12335 [Undibacterium sp. Dicai25W]|uniref:hypothetical protein n=1 Tax=Undibacterium sp. Dicai25W TaxID=3413034 RepID=UPI003BF11ECB